MNFLLDPAPNQSFRQIAEKVLANERITEEEGLELYACNELGFLGSLAHHVKTSHHGQKIFFNRNFHIEPTNLCVFDCGFCSYARTFRERKQPIPNPSQREGDKNALSPLGRDGEGLWELTEEEILNRIKEYDGKPITEVHIVGGVHPKMDLEFFCDVIRKIKTYRPALHVKSFTAVELEYMFRKAKVSVEEGLKKLKEAGMDSLPGGGAEIFHPEIREKICADKATTAQWLEIHETAHRLGIPSNCTILYGHIENYLHRIHHMKLLRDLQDRTHGFNAFIPLKFRRENNAMSYLKETNMLEDLKNYAVSRIFLDNIPHLKAYWPMISRGVAQISLSFGVDDMDGTIDETTKIYSMAGAEEQHPVMSTKEIVRLIKQAGFIPIERDSVYHEIRDYSKEGVKEGIDLPILS